MPELDPEISKAILKQGNTATTRITSKGKSKELIPHKMENKVNRTIETRPQEGAEREILSGQTENHDNGRRRSWTSAIVTDPIQRTTGLGRKEGGR